MSDDSSITLVTVGLLKKYVGDQERLGVSAQGRTVAEILAKLGIPSALVAIVMVEGRQVMKDYVPRAGDVVKLIPLMGGG
ncbi:MAG: MoaD/ThiS family protein [Anaerolineae bacterium]|nr:MoaD/ThiS family protein [Anaerolineae bacterium]